MIEKARENPRRLARYARQVMVTSMSAIARGISDMQWAHGAAAGNLVTLGEDPGAIFVRASGADCQDILMACHKRAA